MDLPVGDRDTQPKEREGATLNEPTTAHAADLGPEGHVVNMAGEPCANSGCRDGGVIGEAGAYLHRNRETTKLVLLCPGCSLLARLNDSLRLPLVAL